MLNIEHGVDYPVFADANSIQRIPALQLFDPAWAWILKQPVDGRFDSYAIPLGDALQLTTC
jgi:hypothetical protein